MPTVSKCNCALAACLIASGWPSALGAAEQASRQTAARVEPVAVRIDDGRGRVLRAQALPASEQAVIARLQRSMEESARQEARGVAITIRCTFPPLTCTIVIGRGGAPSPL
jgi:hypothetical protein